MILRRNKQVALWAGTLLLAAGVPSIGWAHPGGTQADEAAPSGVAKHPHPVSHQASDEETASETETVAPGAGVEVDELLNQNGSLTLAPGEFKQWGTQQVAPPTGAQGDSSGPNIPDYVGKIGLGFHNSDTPLGMRMWLNERFGFDVGLGANINGVFDGAVPSWGVAVEGGILFSLIRVENMIVLIRGGLQVDFDDRGESDDRLAFDLEGLIGIEYFLAALGLPNVSLSAGLSVTARLSWQENTEQFNYNLFTSFRDFDLVETASLGFHFYF